MDERPLPPAPELVLQHLLKRDNYEQWNALLDPKMFPEELRPYYNALTTYYDEIDSQGDLDLTPGELDRLVGNQPGVAANNTYSYIASTNTFTPLSLSSIRAFLSDAGAKQLGALALDWSQAKPSRRAELRDKILEVATALSTLEEVVDSRDKVEPLVVGAVTSLSTELRPRVPFGFSPSLDEATGGGSPTGKLGAIMAPLGVGKTLSLTNYGAAASRAGIPVYHFTLEMDQYTITQWYYSILTGVPFQQLQSRQEEALNAWQDSWGEIRIFDYSGRYCSISKVEAETRKYTNVSGQSPGLLLVDYLALCDRKGDDLYSSLGTEARKLRKLAVRANLAVVTAVQANRAAMFPRGPNDRPKTELHHTADSMEIPRVMDWMVLLSQDSLEKMGGRMRAELSKNRLGFDNVMVNLTLDYSRLRMTELGHENYWNGGK